MRTVLLVIRILTGIVFVFSGFVKGVDPFGSVFKFNDYLTAFGLEGFRFISLPAAYFLCTIEFLTGIMLISGIRIRAGICLAFGMMLFFTPLTFFLAIKNPVSDCGCFGDAIHLTNWQTFFKNLVIISFTIALLIGRNMFTPIFSRRKEVIVSTAAAFIFALFIGYNQIYLPVIDFLPYKVNTNIREAMSIPEGAKPDRYETIFIYEKEGERKEFTLENYPGEDTTWTFIDAKSYLVEKGYTPPMQGFIITDPSGNSLTDSVLSYNKPVFVTTIRDADAVGNELIDKVIQRGMEIQKSGAVFMILTSSASESLKSEKQFRTGLMDEVVLKSMVRSDPGYMIINNGTIVGKWSGAGLPSEERLKKLIETITK